MLAPKRGYALTWTASTGEAINSGRSTLSAPALPPQDSLPWGLPGPRPHRFSVLLEQGGKGSPWSRNATRQYPRWRSLDLKLILRADTAPASVGQVSCQSPRERSRHRAAAGPCSIPASCSGPRRVSRTLPRAPAPACEQAWGARGRRHRRCAHAKIGDRCLSMATVALGDSRDGCARDGCAWYDYSVEDGPCGKDG
jgi:hypothetical protein